MHLKNMRTFFMGIVLLTIVETKLLASTTLEVKNPPRLNLNIVTTIQGFSPKS
ncbi:hypothetical protein [Metabacillus sp. B2-18]|uniref:hypothetical protein n=1 Tax=Metabacillus sp. B2-18 TaxID=2897333 RepID=UPI001E28DB35|nr:hypothetical protein [Metabacillus sp. B2-18]UGB30004.1 hypothetical protein LPC09_20160 [Metabacillus sp. B2-18]